jgi:creatinine amidohydrolase
MRSLRVADLAWPEAGRRASDGALLLVPLGATEQHGPHLPLSTDTDIAVALSERVAAECDDVVVAPPVGYGSSGEHAGFPGTVSIGQEALRLLVVELVRSAATTYNAVALLSAHGGNAEPMAAAVDQLQSEGHRIASFGPRWEGEPHAGRAETAMMLALRPGFVRMELAAPGNLTLLSDLLPQLRAGGVRAVSDSGVLGDPSGATVAEGRALLTELAATLRREITDWRAGWRT